MLYARIFLATPISTVTGLNPISFASHHEPSRATRRDGRSSEPEPSRAHIKTEMTRWNARRIMSQTGRRIPSLFSS
jgi:hypothetical protein